MLIVERQQRVLEILRDRKAVELDELAREMEVSASTIRRDLEALERKGVVARTHGGAVYRGPEAEEQSVESPKPASGGESPSQGGVVLSERMKEHVDAKMAIGRWTAAQVQPHMTLLLDGVSIANLFSDHDQVELSLLGGNLYPRTGVTVGPITTGCLADLYADLAIFSVAGIDDDAAFNINLPMAQVEQLMLRQATRSLLLMDSSKFGRKSLVRVCGLGEVDQILTDKAIAGRWRESMGDRLVIAE